MADRRPELVGATFLSNWFGEDVLAPIRLHVTAKRYLCATDPNYIDALSPASVRSVSYQGGPMTPAEIDGFETTPLPSNAVLLRVWDDRAKVPGAPTATLAVFRNLLAELARLSVSDDFLVAPSGTGPRVLNSPRLVGSRIIHSPFRRLADAASGFYYQAIEEEQSQALAAFGAALGEYLDVPGGLDLRSTAGKKRFPRSAASRPRQATLSS